MSQRRYTLRKAERLSWKRHIDQLFLQGNSFVAYPLRVIYLETATAQCVPASILISVPKKKFKHAVKRNLIKRRIREAYRLHKTELTDALNPAEKHLHLAFVYLGKDVATLSELNQAMMKVFRILRTKIP